MSKQRVSENQLLPEHYETPPIGILKWIFLVLLCITLGFLFNFPLTQVIEGKIQKAISGVKNCNIAYKELSLNFLFLPNLNLRTPSVSGRCIGGKEIKLDELAIKFRGPGFSPFGVKLLTQAGVNKSKFEVYSTIGPKEQVISVPSAIFHFSDFKNLYEDVFKIRGIGSLNALGNVKNSSLSSGTFKLDLKGLEIPPQTISGFDVPSLVLGTGVVKGKYNNQKLTFDNLDLGNAHSPIRATFKGTIDINPRSMKNSRLNLTGKVNFSKEFLDDFSILNIFLQKIKMENGFYMLRVTGTVSRPIPSSQ
ncbi:MAG: type II secretion system protein GspN [Bacteriovoracaceae bacterium]|jgi:type II secretion system protein N|nr:type II secretion system protein GspN [Bacteriovoracaceae bacterium]